jgi:hypothetical protein
MNADTHPPSINDSIKLYDDSHTSRPETLDLGEKE